MKLQTLISRIKLHLSVLYNSISIGYSPIHVQVVSVAIKIVTAVGLFIHSKIFGDSVSVNDQINKQVSKVVSGGISVQDNIVTAINKVHIDEIGVHDDSGAYFAEDYVTGAPAAQTYTMVAAVVKAVTKVLSDTANIGSFGVLRIQNYTVDTSYFAEDYVGESRVFG